MLKSDYCSRDVGVSPLRHMRDERQHFPPSVVTLAMDRELWSSFDEHRSVWYRKRSSHAPGFFEEQNNTTSVWRFGAAVRHFWNAVSLVRQGQQQMEPDRKDDFFPLTSLSRLVLWQWFFSAVSCTIRCQTHTSCVRQSAYRHQSFPAVL